MAVISATQPVSKFASPRHLLCTAVVVSCRLVHATLLIVEGADSPNGGSYTLKILSSSLGFELHYMGGALGSIKMV